MELRDYLVKVRDVRNESRHSWHERMDRLPLERFYGIHPRNTDEMISMRYWWRAYWALRRDKWAKSP